MLCKGCLEYFANPKNFILAPCVPWIYCHHEEAQDKKEETRPCWCKYGIYERTPEVSAGNNYNSWKIIFCPVCGRML